MKMYFYRGPQLNFGDELNPWLWPKLLPGAFDDDERTLFLGIGSILFDFFRADQTKIVFGAGYGGYTAAPQLDDSWQVHFVRGPRTARRFGLDPALGIGDAAILLRSVVPEADGQRGEILFMPHWENRLWGNWQEAARLAGMRYVDPATPVDTVLDAIRGARLVVTEAMHGAIVADALRVPWIALQPFRRAHHGKWLDWSEALGIDLRPVPFTASSLPEAIATSLQRGRVMRAMQRHASALKPLGERFFAERAAAALARAARQPASLSSDRRIRLAHEQMLEHLARLRQGLGSAQSDGAAPGMPQAPAAATPRAPAANEHAATSAAWMESS